MKSVAGRLRLDLAQYRDLESFAAFGSDLDKASKAQLERGQRLVELLKQPQYSPYPVERQVVSIWLGTTGELDDVPVEDVRRFEREFLDYLDRSHEGIYGAILSTGKLEDTTVESLKDAVKRLREGASRPTAGGGTRGADAEDAGRRSRSSRPTSAARKSDRRRHRQPELRADDSEPSAPATRPRPRTNRRHAGHTSGLPPPNPFGAVDQEDHPRDGAHRRVADPRGAAAGQRVQAVRRGDHPRDHGGRELRPTSTTR